MVDAALGSVYNVHSLYMMGLSIIELTHESNYIIAACSKIRILGMVWRVNINITKRNNKAVLHTTVPHKSYFKCVVLRTQFQFKRCPAFFR